jgi:hypothetical protein
MSTQTLCPPTTDLILLDPPVLEGRLRDLIRGYVRQRSAELAQAVVEHLDALCLHSDLHDPSLFCAYRRLARHWRWLAQQHAVSTLPG